MLTYDSIFALLQMEAVLCALFDNRIMTPAERMASIAPLIETVSSVSVVERDALVALSVVNQHVSAVHADVAYETAVVNRGGQCSDTLRRAFDALESHFWSYGMGCTRSARAAYLRDAADALRKARAQPPYGAIANTTLCDIRATLYLLECAECLLDFDCA